MGREHGKGTSILPAPGGSYSGQMPGVSFVGGQLFLLCFSGMKLILFNEILLEHLKFFSYASTAGVADSTLL
jgi:hypothetical protein